MTEPNSQELAQQGNPQAIASILNEKLQSQNIEVSTHLDDRCLEVMLEGDSVPERYEFVDFIRSEIATLEPESIQRVKVFGKKRGDTEPEWHQEFALELGTYSMLTFPSEPTPTPEDLPPELPPKKAIRQPLPESALSFTDRKLHSTLVLVSIVIGIWAISVAVFVGKIVTGKEKLNLLESFNGNQESPDTENGLFRDAVNKATGAARLAQQAKTKAEWSAVSREWQDAIALMKRVPSSSPNYEVAQKKAVEYQKYLVYAQESAKSSPK